MYHTTYKHTNNKKMKAKGTAIIVIIAILVIGAIWGVSSYNSMVNKDEAVKSQWGNVQNAYQRRADLIPNLVSTVKGYANHEQQTLIGTIEARAQATQALKINPDQLTAENIQKYQAAQGELSAALGRLMVIKEAYPNLKADKQFTQLMDNLEGTENRINVERVKFNDLTKDYNTYARSFPRSIIAGMFNFDQKAYFEADQTSQSAPKVEF